MNEPDKGHQPSIDQAGNHRRPDLAKLFEEAKALHAAEIQSAGPRRYQYEAVYHSLAPDGNPIGMRYQGETLQGERVEIPHDYYLPPELEWIGGYTLENLATLENHPSYFHGTRQSRIAGIIADQGLKKYEEPTARAQLHAVYATPDPILAAHHSWNNGPEDSSNPAQDKTDPTDPVVVLKINIDNYPVDQLSGYHEAARRTYRSMRGGHESNYVGERMGPLVPIDLLSVLAPQPNGEVHEIALREWQSH